MSPGEVTWVEEYFVRLIDTDQYGGVLTVAALLIAFAVGAVHALAPGHGKGIAAAYLVGSRGRPRHALGLGAVVSAMHTVSVVALGVLLYTITRMPTGAEHLAPVMTLVSGVIVVAVGVGLVARQVRVRRRRRVNAGAPAFHDHDHALPPEVSPLSRRGLVLLGLSGGLLPSPSAFLVLATALFVGRAAFGFVLVAAFSIGLAATLTLVGLGALHGRDFVARRAADNPRFARLARALPVVSSAGVLAGGLWITAMAAAQLA